MANVPSTAQRPSSPLAVALAGITGGLLGALVGSIIAGGFALRVEDERSQNAREEAKVAEQRQERVAAYSEFTGAAERYGFDLILLSAVPSAQPESQGIADPTPEIRRDWYRESFGRFIDAITAVEIVGSPQAIEIAEEANRTALSVLGGTVSGLDGQSRMDSIVRRFTARTKRELEGRPG